MAADLEEIAALRRVTPPPAEIATFVVDHPPAIAERCLTLANEQGGAWPPWVSSRMHTCLVGCLECQRSCPVNPKLEVAPSGITFSAEETRHLLDSDPAHHPHSETGIARKLAWLGQPGLIQVLGRNLHAVLKRETAETARLIPTRERD